MTTLVFDTETTGLVKHPRAKDSVQPQIIEWGGVLIDEDGVVLDEMDILINPGRPLPPEIVRITGIVDGDLVDQPSFKEVSGRLREYFAAADILVAHNLPFDSSMMRLELARAGIDNWPWPGRNICTVQEHAEEWGRRPKLTELYHWYFGKVLAQKHRALDDVHALAQIVIESGVLNGLATTTHQD